MDKNIYEIKKLNFYKDSYATLALIERMFTNFMMLCRENKDGAMEDRGELIHNDNDFWYNIRHPDEHTCESAKEAEQIVLGKLNKHEYFIKSLEEDINYLREKCNYYLKLSSLMMSKNNEYSSYIDESIPYFAVRSELENKVKDQKTLVYGVYGAPSFKKYGILDPQNNVYLFFEGFSDYVSNLGLLKSNRKIKFYEYSYGNFHMLYRGIIYYRNVCYNAYETYCIYSVKKYLELYQDPCCDDSDFLCIINKLLSDISLLNEYFQECHKLMGRNDYNSMYDRSVFLK